MYKKRISIKSRLKGVKGIVQLGGAASCEKLIQLVTFYLMTQWVQPKDYGVFALAWIVIAIAEGFFDFGGGLGFFRDRDDKKIAKEVLNAHYFLCSIFWSLFCAIVAGIFFLFGLKEISLVTFTLILLFVCKAYTMPYTSNLSVDRKYSALALFAIIPSIAGVSIGVGVAFNGGGVWGIVSRYLAVSVAGTMIVFFTSSYSSKLLFDFSRMKSWIKDGWQVCFSNNIGWIMVLQFEQLVVGAAMGSSMLGLLNFAKKPVDITGQVFSLLRQQYLIPRFIDKKSNRKKYMLAELQIFIFISIIIAVIGFFCFEYLLSNYWSEVWKESLNFASILFYIIPLIALQVVLESYMISVGKASKILRVNLTISFMVMISMGTVVFLGGSIKYICVCLLMGYVLKSSLYLFFSFINE